MTSFPKTIKAVGIRKTGDVDVLEDLELPFPVAKPNEVIIKVYTAGTNFIDVYYRKGLYPTPTLPIALGVESAGVIVALPTDEEILSSEEWKKRGLTLGGRVGVYEIGAFAEYAAAPWTRVWPIPDAVPFDVAAAAVVSGLTAISFMTDAHDVKRGESVLVHAIAGGLGLLFAQYGALRGARVIGTTSTEEKAALGRENGAAEVVLYRSEDTVQRVLELTGGEGVEAAFDGVGKDTFESNFKMLARKGTLVSVGNASGPVPPMAPLKLVEKNLKLVRPTLGNYIYKPAESRLYGEELFDLVAKGKLNIKISQRFPFTAEGIRQAQNATVSGKTVGKLVIDIASE